MQLGIKVKDKITGFVGVTIGYVIYISGCNQVLVQPTMGNDGKVEDSRWIDEQRLDITDAKTPIVLDNSKTPGADKPAPRF